MGPPASGLASPVHQEEQNCLQVERLLVLSEAFGTKAKLIVPEYVELCLLL